MDSKAAFNVLVGAVRRYRWQRVAGSKIRGYVKAVRSWLLHNEIEIKRITGANKTPTLKMRRPPNSTC